MKLAPKKVSAEFLIENYEILLIDAFGVLMTSVGALPGAVDFINLLNQRKKPYYILSNGSLYNAEQNQGNYARRGLLIPKERIISSGTLMGKWIAENGFQGKRCLVLGPEPTKNLVREAGALVLDTEEGKPELIIFGHQTGFDFVPMIEHALTLVIQSLEKGDKPLRVLVPNPDVLFPRSETTWGITAGSMALILKRAVELRFPNIPYQIDYLGKPYSALFEEARLREPKGSMVMIGDQLETDIRGANDFGIDSVLVGTGVLKLDKNVWEGDVVPKFIMDDLKLSANLI